MSLISAELRRLFARRFTKIMMVLVLLILGLVAFGVGASSHHRDAGTLANAQAQVDRINHDNEQVIRDCEANQADPNGPDPNKFPPGVPCDQLVWHPTVDDFQPNQVSFRKAAPDLISLVLGGVLAMLGFAIGASFVGAEWNSGGMMNLLLWRPRRVPVLLGKLTALLLGVGGIGVAFAALWTGTVWGVASIRGTTEKVTSGVWQSIALDNARAVALGLFAACLGFAIASIGRHTATALGVAVGYLIVFELGLRIVLEIAQVVRPERFFLSNYVGAWLTKAQWFYNWRSCDRAPGPCEPEHWAIHLNQGLLALGVAVVLTVGVALYTMRRRDIT